MALHDNQAFKDEVRAKNDIVEVVSSYVKLEKRGNRYVGLCPFHGEKTPSFHVIPQMQMYHCFGCKASGDVFKFLQEREHLSFYEALVQLAKRARIPLPKEERTPEEEKAYRERRNMYDALDLAARFYHGQLQAESGKPGLDYLLRRGLTEETIRTYRLGWAPGHGKLHQALRGRFDSETLQKTGLILQRREGPGFMDAFFERVMFPITDLTGRVIGFGGRVLEGNGPKYKNTADTPLFTKRHVLFGLSQAKDAIRTRNQAILVEGYMDVIMPHQVGIKNVVAPLGTALTEEQCKLLRQQAEQVVVAFDSDTAGQMATLRSLDVLYDLGCDVRILRLPDGKDPDEYIRTHGSEGFQRCIDEAMPLVEFKLRKAISKHPDSKAKAIEAVARVLVDLQNDILREEYVDKIVNIFAEGTQAGPDPELKRAIDKQMNRLLHGGFQHNQPDSRNNSKDLGLVGPGSGPQVSPQAGPAQGNPLTRKVTQDDLTWLSERKLIHLLLEYPGFASRIEGSLGSEPFGDALHQTIYTAVKAMVRAGVTTGPIAAQVLDTLVDPDARQVLMELVAKPPVMANAEQEAAHCIENIIWHRLLRRNADLEKQMKALQAAGQPVPEAVIREFADNSRELKKRVRS